MAFRFVIENVRSCMPEMLRTGDRVIMRQPRTRSASFPSSMCAAGAIIPLLAIALGACAPAPSTPRPVGAAGTIVSRCDSTQLLVVDNRTGRPVSVALYQPSPVAQSSGISPYVLAVVPSGAADTLSAPNRPEARIGYEYEAGETPMGRGQGVGPQQGLTSRCIPAG